EEVDYVNAHGTGTEYHDPAETEAIKKALGARAYEVPVSSIKGALGHLMGAAGAVEALATALAIAEGQVPPTANYTTPDPHCDLDYVPNVGRPAQVAAALSISAGIGGNNACLALRRLS
ncbi:MAG: beta-ketoacyl-[acyl-carrier-protein] synthase II, partial [Armatimonadota bacterium]